MASNSPFPILEHDYVWLIVEGVFGDQPPKGAMLWVKDIFYVEEGSLELGPPGKYACCWYGRKLVYVSLEKLCAIHPGQWVRFKYGECIYTGQISKLGKYTKIIRMEPALHGHYHTITVPGIGEYMSFMFLIDEDEIKDERIVDRVIRTRQCTACKFFDEDDAWRKDEYAWDGERCYWCEITSEDAFVEEADKTIIKGRLERSTK